MIMLSCRFYRADARSWQRLSMASFVIKTLIAVVCLVALVLFVVFSQNWHKWGTQIAMCEWYDSLFVALSVYPSFCLACTFAFVCFLCARARRFGVMCIMAFNFTNIAEYKHDLQSATIWSAPSIPCGTYVLAAAAAASEHVLPYQMPSLIVSKD